MVYTPKFSGKGTRLRFRGWCDHEKCLTLCLWNALLINGVPDMKRFSKNGAPPA